jgi:hypothetical protein
VREQYGHEHLGVVDAGRDRSTVLVDDFGEDEVFEQVHASVLAAFGGNAGGFGGGVDVVWRDTPARVACRWVDSVSTSEALNTNLGAMLSRLESCSSASRRSIEA